MRQTLRALALVFSLVVLSTATSPATAALPELDVPLMQQIGEKTNCGPTAAAMVIGAYEGTRSPRALKKLQDRLGQWSWEKYPIRRLSLPGYDAGASTPDVLKATMNQFAPKGLTFGTTSKHPWVPKELWSMVALRAELEASRPVVVLVSSKLIWDMPSAVGLHWVVVRGLEDGKVVFNDPADKTRRLIDADRFWQAWALDGLFATLFDRFTGLVADRGLR